MFQLTEHYNLYWQKLLDNWLFFPKTSTLL